MFREQIVPKEKADRMNRPLCKFMFSNVEQAKFKFIETIPSVQ